MAQCRLARDIPAVGTRLELGLVCLAVEQALFELLTL